MLKSFKIQLPRLSIDWALGLLSAIPFAYPKEPFYWIVIAIFILGLYRFKLQARDSINVLLALLLILLVAIVNLCNSIYTLSVFGTYLAIVLLFFRYIVRSSEEFLHGFSFVTTIYTLATFLIFLILRPYSNGLLMFINSDYRMWAEGYLIEWPNVFSAFLVIGGFIHILLDNKKTALMHFSSAILTTSRTALLAIFIYAIFSFIRSKITMKSIYAILIIISVFAVYRIYNQDEIFISFLYDRIIKTGDRFEIYKNLIECFIENPLGIGNVPFNLIDDAYQSYHSSFLKVLSRYGIFGLLLYICLIYPKGLIKGRSMEINMPIIFILLCGIVQDFMFHLHIAALYSVLLSHREKLMRREFMAL